MMNLISNAMKWICHRRGLVEVNLCESWGNRKLNSTKDHFFVDQDIFNQNDDGVPVTKSFGSREGWKPLDCSHVQQMKQKYVAALTA